MPKQDKSLFFKWVRANALGWLLGVPIIAVLALLGEAVGIGGSQVLVGAGMGVSVGWLQARALRTVLTKTTPWFWACVVGLAVPFLVTDIAALMEWNFPYYLQVAVTAAGLIVGAWQASLLRSVTPKALWWLPVSVLGWALAAATVGAADGLLRTHSVRGLLGALAYRGLISVGGLLLGLITGAGLTRLLAYKAEK